MLSESSRAIIEQITPKATRTFVNYSKFHKEQQLIDNCKLINVNGYPLTVIP